MCRFSGTVWLWGHESGHKSSSASLIFKPAGSTQERIHISDEQTGNDIRVYGVYNRGLHEMTSSGGNSRTYSRESDCHGDTKTHRRCRHDLPVSVSSCWGLAPGFCRVTMMAMDARLITAACGVFIYPGPG